MTIWNILFEHYFDISEWRRSFQYIKSLVVILRFPASHRLNLCWLEEGRPHAVGLRIFGPVLRSQREVVTDSIDIKHSWNICAMKKTLLLSMKSWMVNRDPYNGLWNNPYITGWYNPLYNPTNQVFFHCSYGAHSGFSMTIWIVYCYLGFPGLNRNINTKMHHEYLLAKRYQIALLNHFSPISECNFSQHCNVSYKFG